MGGECGNEVKGAARNKGQRLQGREAEAAGIALIDLPVFGAAGAGYAR